MKDRLAAEEREEAGMESPTRFHPHAPPAKRDGNVGQTNLNTWESGDLEAKMNKTLDSIKERLVVLCQEFPQCTGNYTIQVERYNWKYHGKLRFWADKAFKKRPSPDSIMRMFRELVEEGRLKPTGKILARRMAREAAIRRREAERKAQQGGL